MSFIYTIFFTFAFTFTFSYTTMKMGKTPHLIDDLLSDPIWSTMYPLCLFLLDHLILECDLPPMSSHAINWPQSFLKDRLVSLLPQCMLDPIKYAYELFETNLLSKLWHCHLFFFNPSSNPSLGKPSLCRKRLLHNVIVMTSLMVINAYHIFQHYCNGLFLDVFNSICCCCTLWYYHVHEVCS